MTEYAEEVYAEQFHKIIELFQPTMDDFLYIFDFTNDEYCISSSAVKRFRIPSVKFTNTGEVFSRLVHSADVEKLFEDLDRARNGLEDFHNLEYRWLDREGNAIWINCRGRVVKDNEGKPRYLIGCINEIGKNQKADNVSGLLRESKFRQQIESLPVDSMHGYIMRFGIDRFKEINENQGMEYGDMVLRKTAECIKECLLPHQELYRILSDEFIVADFTTNGVVNARKLYKQARSRIDRFIEENKYEVFYTLSAGIVDLDSVGDKSYASIMRVSEFSLGEAKSRGRNQYYIYDEKDYNSFARKKSLLYTMRRAINNNYEGFEAYFQPIVDIRKNCFYGAETLLRFRSEETGVVSPMEFIPVLEESGLIVPVGKWVLNQAVAACSEIQQKIPDFRVSVNVSYVQLAKSDVLSDIRKSLEAHNLCPKSLIVELTESGMLESNPLFQKFCEGLKQCNISLALDDFGTGYSNFHYLYHLNPNTIKIDRSFTWSALQNQHDYTILKHMIDMSHGIDMELCIEGIETDEELDKVAEMGPDYIQGYYFGKPCNLEQFCQQFLK